MLYQLLIGQVVLYPSTLASTRMAKLKILKFFWQNMGKQKVSQRWVAAGFHLQTKSRNLFVNKSFVSC